MTETAITPPKMKMVVVNPSAVLMGISVVLMGISVDGLVLVVAGQVEGCCVTITPV